MTVQAIRITPVKLTAPLICKSITDIFILEKAEGKVIACLSRSEKILL